MSICLGVSNKFRNTFDFIDNIHKINFNTWARVNNICRMEWEKCEKMKMKMKLKWEKNGEYRIINSEWNFEILPYISR